MYYLNGSLRRSKLEIYVGILIAIKDKPLKLTHITLKAKVNFLTIKDSLLQLTQHHLIEERVAKTRKQENVFYAITKKGAKFLKIYQEMVFLFDSNPQAPFTFSFA